MRSRQATSELAPYAVLDETSLGRAHTEPGPLPAGESPFDLDRYRITSCTAFRRLLGKTQVFVTDSGDHFRTRLTHTLEVVAQAQRLARRLNLNARLAGAIALAHDLGHAPFGHAGESALAQMMRDHGGFEHNLQSLRVVDYLEHPYPGFRGLNLSFELRESLLKHRTRYDRPDAEHDPTVADLMAGGPAAPLEGQTANLADTIAYTLHDVEDGLNDGLLSEEALDECALWRQAAEPIRRLHGDRVIAAVRRPILDRIGEDLVADAVETSLARLEESGVRSPQEVRTTKTELLGFSPVTLAGLAQLQDMLQREVYRHHRVIRMDAKARRMIRELFEAYLAEPRLLPERYVRRLPEQGPHRVICDYLAGMTDRFCQQEHRRIFAPFHFG